MLKVCVNPIGLPDWFNADLGAVIELIRLADERGVDQVVLSEHVAFGDDLGSYPFGEFNGKQSDPWYEPITLLAGIAAATQRIRISTGILIAPLRPAVLLAKQLATLDVLSGGRLDLGVGTGWHKAEFDACGVPFDDRIGLLEEQVRAWQALWGPAPASFKGKHVQFDAIYQRPTPIQPKGVPVLFGVPPTASNFRRIAELGQGWLPMGVSQEQLAEHTVSLRREFVSRDRDPDTLEVRHVLLPSNGDKGPGLEATLAEAEAWVNAGVTAIEMYPRMFCDGPDQFDAFLSGLLSLKTRL